MSIIYAFLIGAAVFGLVVGLYILAGVSWIYLWEKYDWLPKPIVTSYKWESYIGNGLVTV